MMAIKPLIFFSTVFALAAASTPELTLLTRDVDILVVTSETKGAIAEQSFLSKGIKTFSMNENQVVMYSPTCQVTAKTIDQLSSEEQSMLANAKAHLSRDHQRKVSFRNQDDLDGMTFDGFSFRGMQGVQFGNNNRSFRRLGSGDSNDNTYDLVIGNGLTSFIRDGITVVETSQNSYSITSTSMPNNLARIFVHHDIVTFVYRDGLVLMKPEVCLSSDERQILSELKSAAEIAKQQ